MFSGREQGVWRGVRAAARTPERDQAPGALPRSRRAAASAPTAPSRSSPAAGSGIGAAVIGPMLNPSFLLLVRVIVRSVSSLSKITVKRKSSPFSRLLSISYDASPASRRKIRTRPRGPTSGIAPFRERRSLKSIVSLSLLSSQRVSPCRPLSAMYSGVPSRT